MHKYSHLQLQMGVFLEWRQSLDSTQYNIPVIAKFGKEVAPNRLESTLRAFFIMCKELRTRIDLDDKRESCQWIAPDMVIPIVRKKLTEDFAKIYINNVFIKPYNLLSEEPPCKTEIMETPEHVYWLWVFQHIFIDGTANDPIFFQIDMERSAT